MRRGCCRRRGVDRAGSWVPDRRALAEHRPRSRRSRETELQGVERGRPLDGPSQLQDRTTGPKRETRRGNLSAGRPAPSRGQLQRARKSAGGKEEGRSRGCARDVIARSVAGKGEGAKGGERGKGTSGATGGEAIGRRQRTSGEASGRRQWACEGGKLRLQKTGTRATGSETPGPIGERKRRRRRNGVPGTIEREGGKVTGTEVKECRRRGESAARARATRETNEGGSKRRRSERARASEERRSGAEKTQGTKSRGRKSLSTQKRAVQEAKDGRRGRETEGTRSGRRGRETEGTRSGRCEERTTTRDRRGGERTAARSGAAEPRAPRRLLALFV